MLNLDRPYSAGISVYSRGRPFDSTIFDTKRRYEYDDNDLTILEIINSQIDDIKKLINKYNFDAIIFPSDSSNSLHTGNRDVHSKIKNYIITELYDMQYYENPNKKSFIQNVRNFFSRSNNEESIDLNPNIITNYSNELDFSYIYSILYLFLSHDFLKNFFESRPENLDLDFNNNSVTGLKQTISPFIENNIWDEDSVKALHTKINEIINAQEANQQPGAIPQLVPNQQIPANQQPQNYEDIYVRIKILIALLLKMSNNIKDFNNIFEDYDSQYNIEKFLKIHYQGQTNNDSNFKLVSSINNSQIGSDSFKYVNIDKFREDMNQFENQGWVLVSFSRSAFLQSRNGQHVGSSQVNQEFKRYITFSRMGNDKWLKFNNDNNQSNNSNINPLTLQECFEVNDDRSRRYMTYSLFVKKNYLRKHIQRRFQLGGNDNDFIRQTQKQINDIMNNPSVLLFDNDNYRIVPVNTTRGGPRKKKLLKKYSQIKLKKVMKKKKKKKKTLKKKQV